MPDYARISRDKVKTRKELASRYKHNERIYDVQNASMDSSANVEMVDTYGHDYNYLVRETLRDLKAKGVNQRKIRTKGRSPQTLAYEYIFGFSRSAKGKFDVHAWAKDTLDFVDREMNPPGHKVTIQTSDGEKTEEVQNIKHAVLHMDEETPHLHVLVVPIDEKGHLNAGAYDGRSFLKNLHTRYTEEIGGKYGLERGREGSVAKREDIAKYYRMLEETVDASLRDPYPGETLDGYRAYAENELQKEKAHHRNDIVHMQSELVSAQTEARNRYRKKNAKMKEAADKWVEVERTLSESCPSVGDITPGNIEKLAKENERLKRAEEDYPDREAAEQMRKTRREMLLWQEEREHALEESRKEGKDR